MLIYINLLCDSNFSSTEKNARIYGDKTAPGKNGVACNSEYIPLFLSTNRMT